MHRPDYQQCSEILLVFCLQIYGNIWYTEALELVGCRRRQLSLDEEIASAFEVGSLDFLDDGETYLTELDMAFTKEQYEKFHPNSKNNSKKISRPKRKAINDELYRWQEKTIPYSIQPGVFSKRDLREIQMAMDEWSNYTCLQFVEHTSQISFLGIGNATGCFSFYGSFEGMTSLGLAKGCRKKGIIVHEIGHTIGFVHEQARPDREMYVDVLWENVDPLMYNQFAYYDKDSVNTYNVSYDYGSVMHYGAMFFSSNGNITIRTKDRSMQHVIGTGQEKGLTFYDIKVANLMYSCHNECDPEIQCRDPGFVAKDCKCYCPGDPIQPCDTMSISVTETKIPTAMDSSSTYKRDEAEQPCRDINRNCEQWVSEGKCDTSGFVIMYCRKSCKLCVQVNEVKVASNSVDRQPPALECTDTDDKCQHWRDLGHCNKFPDMMLRVCTRTCSQCGRDDEISQKTENGSGPIVISFRGFVSSLVATWPCVILWWTLSLDF